MLEKGLEKISATEINRPSGGCFASDLWLTGQWQCMRSIFSNEAVGNHSGSMTALALEDIPAKFLLLKFSTDENLRKVLVASDNDRCFGVSLDEAIPGDPVAIQFLGGDRTLKMTAATAVRQGSFVFLAKDGRVQERPTKAGTYHRVGLALTSATAGNLLEVLSCLPVETIVA